MEFLPKAWQRLNANFHLRAAAKWTVPVRYEAEPLDNFEM